MKTRSSLAVCLPLVLCGGMRDVPSASHPFPHLAYSRHLFDRPPLVERVANDNLAC
jgi:hypothetical protein